MHPALAGQVADGRVHLRAQSVQVLVCLGVYVYL
jgi:hypothetical protein